jgi:hypothetical protein
MSGALDFISKGMGKLGDSQLTNPNKIFGVDLWGREQPGGVLDKLENSIQDRTGLPTATIGRYNHDYGPQTAGLIAGSILGGGALAGGGAGGGAGGAAAGSPVLDIFGSTAGAPGWSGPLMPAAVPATAAELGGTTGAAGGTSALSMARYGLLANSLMGGGGGQSGMMPHHQAPALMQQPNQPFVPVYPGALSPFLQG